MKCACGMEFGPGGKWAFGRHRQECAVFWQDIKTKMEGISRKLRGELTPVSSREWDMRRPRDLPSSKTLIDWLGAWSAVQVKVGHGLSSPGPQKQAAAMPSVDDFAKMTLELSRQYYGNGQIIGGNVFDKLRPAGWPQYTTMMKLHGYAADQHGWRQFVFDHIGLSVVGNADAQRIAADRRLDRAALVDGIDRSDTEYYEAMKYRAGLPICEETFLRTGRMFVR